MSETPVEVAETVPDETEYEQYPDDHPLVTSLKAQKEELSQLKTRLAAAEPQSPNRIRELKELKAKAKRLEEASKSEAEKAADRIAKAEAEAASVPAKVADALRTHLAALHDLDKDDVELFLTADDPDVLLKQVARLLAQSGTRKRNHVPREGTNPDATGGHSDLREFTEKLFHSSET